MIRGTAEESSRPSAVVVARRPLRYGWRAKISQTIPNISMTVAMGHHLRGRRFVVRANGAIHVGLADEFPRVTITVINDHPPPRTSLARPSLVARSRRGAPWTQSPLVDL
jgi:hypothetical protein